MTTPPVLLLDVMDTLVHDPFTGEVLRFFAMDRETYFAAKSRDAWLEFEHGRIDETEYAARHFHDRRAIDLDGLKRCLQRSYRWLPGIEPLVADLRDAGVEMHALSNYPRWFELVEEAVGLSRYVKWTFVSCLTGVRKPAAEAYLGAARALDREPSDCLFVDDRESNCAGAAAAGMPAIRFENASRLRAELRRRGLL